MRSSSSGRALAPINERHVLQLDSVSCECLRLKLRRNTPKSRVGLDPPEVVMEFLQICGNHDIERHNKKWDLWPGWVTAGFLDGLYGGTVQQVSLIRGQVCKRLLAEGLGTSALIAGKNLE